MTSTRTFALEIGSEEIPAFDLADATKQMHKLVPDVLDRAGIEHGDVEIYTSPRRQIFVVKDVAESTKALTEKFRGPSLKVALDEAGKPTKALEGFARSKGVAIEDLTREGEGDKCAFYAVVNTPERPVFDMLGAVCLDVINGIKWPKSMNWGSTKEVYSRPIRWLCALFGSNVVKFDYANITSGNTTIGHRFLNPGPHVVKSADDLVSTVESANVISTEEKRRDKILDEVKAIEQKTGLVAKIPEKTLVEVTNLNEYPTPMVGTFDEEFLAVPEEIIVDAMLMHQRYFPLYDKNDKLSNKFVIISNGDPKNEEIIVEGNERVVAARLYDAKFFYEEDLKVPLADNVEKLSQVIFQEKLGTIKNKNDRNVELAKQICKLADLSGDDEKDALRATLLAKADLPSNAVIEFTSVQGIMGGYYAKASGENDRVALAIKEHYNPKFAGDEVPSDIVGKVVAAADKLDTVVGLISVGERPTGSKDPFGVRRAALGVVSILSSGLDINLEAAVDASIAILKAQIPSIDEEKTKSEVVDFFISRASQISRDSGVEADTVDAVVSTGVVEPLAIISRCKILEKVRSENRATFDDLASAFVRAKNLSDKSIGVAFDKSLFNNKETNLFNAIASANDAKEKFSSTDFEKLICELANLKGPIDDFFENVMVMDKDETIRKNRIALVNSFVEVFDNTADFSKFTS